MVVANIFMESLEEKALNTITIKPSTWIRYVDDTFVIWPHGSTALERFHRHLNEQSNSPLKGKTNCLSWMY